MKSPIDNLFCEEFRKLAADHISKCETCRSSITIVVNELPFLKMIIGSDTTEKINQFLTKENEHG